MTVRTKLILGFSLVLACAVIVGLSAIASMSSMNAKSNEVANVDYPVVGAVDDMATAINTLVRHQREGVGSVTAADKKAAFGEAGSDASAFLGALKTYGTLATAADDKRRIADLHTRFSKYLSETSSVAKLTLAGNSTAANTELATADPTFSALEDKLAATAKIEDASVTESVKASASSYHTARTTVAVLLVAALVAASLVVFFLSRSLAVRLGTLVARLRELSEQSLRPLTGALASVANGDLTHDVHADTEPIERPGRDEVGVLAGTYNEMLVELQSAVGSYNEMREQVAGLVTAISRSSQTVASSSQQMAATSEEAGRAVGEIAHAVSDVAQGAERQVRMIEDARRSSEQTEDAAEQTSAIAREGVEAAAKASDAMVALRSSSSEVSAAIHTLSVKSEQIGGIIETITGIAGQTNLLALNAAIEAARAGEQGRGFAVVAEEVRKLAEESRHAAGSIAELIEEIQAETERAVRVVEQGARQTDESATTVETTRAAFEGIGTAVEEMRNRIAQVVTTTGEVVTVAEQSSASAEEVSASTEETSASTQEIAASAQTLAATAEDLNQLVAKFRVAT
jgi:methyl-accepting chemotaxis protein